MFDLTNFFFSISYDSMLSPTERVSIRRSPSGVKTTVSPVKDETGGVGVGGPLIIAKRRLPT